MSLSESGGSGSALLLRLFESSFFDVHLAIGYLKTYPNSIGITHYLIDRLRAFEYEDVEFYWPQLCYLVITRPTDSVALENFLLERCEEDAHIATLWYLQASMSDLASNPNSDQFAVCRRILNRVQSIIFTDPPLPPPSSESPSTSPSTPSKPSIVPPTPQQRKLNAPKGSLVGIGLLAAAFAMPRLVNTAGRMVVEQGRRIEQVSKLDAIEQEEAEAEGEGEGKEKEDNSGSEEEKVKKTTSAKSPNGSIKSKPQSPRNSRRSSGQPNYLPGARIEATPAIPFSSSTSSTPIAKPESKSSSSFFPNPFSSSSKILPSKPSSGSGSLGRAKSLRTSTASSSSSRLNSSQIPSISVPSLPITSHSTSHLATTSSLSTHHLALTGSTLPGYSLPKTFLSHLLLLQACRSQLDLVRSLQDISTRLVLVPKPARVSSLRAELTVLNHGLPRGCSLGMSTRLSPPIPSPSTSAPSHTTAAKPSISVTTPSSASLTTTSPFSPLPRPPKPRRKQSRVVRISPGESVVLNSADRAPFVVYVEVLEEDLDFDPDRRTNWEDLRRALRERDGLTSSTGLGSSVGGAYGQSRVGARASLESGLDGYGTKGGASSNSRPNLTKSPTLGSTTNGFHSTTPTATTPFAERAEFALGGDISTLNDSDLSNGGGNGDLEPEGEMDLVEQLYGDISLRDESLMRSGMEGGEGGEEEEEEIKNRDADELAWSRKEQEKAERRKRRSSTVSSAASNSTRTRGTMGGGEPSLSVNRQSINLDRTKLSTSSTTSTAGPRPGGRSVQARQVISLDDYAERMRMAAIMLAQLDASQTAARGVVSAGTAAAGTLVGLPVATVAGVGGLVGAGLGAGLGAVKARLGGRKEPANGVGQASSGTKTSLDTASAAEGTSAVAGAPPLNPATAMLSQSAASVEGGSLNGSQSSSSQSSSTTAPAPTQRARVLAPQDAAAIRERIMSEMMALEEERMERMRGSVQARKGWSQTSGLGGTTDNAVVMRAVNKDDPSGAVFAESFESKSARIRAASPFGHLPHWSLISCIVKTGADLRQEQLAVQLISEFGRIWKEEQCPAWIYYFRILVTSENSGLIETITDSVSIHSIKKDAYARVAEDGTQAFASFTLADYFTDTYGSPTSPKYRKAQTAFIESLAAYSVICYLLQLKDRHNGNILIDRAGHLIHIDFGFMLSNSPGSLGFEMAPFKLPQDYIDILGGFDSPEFAKFKELFKRCFRDVRKHAERIITLVELMQKDSNLPCFANGDLTSQQLRERFVLSLTQAQVDDYAEKLILNSATSSFTKLYDLFQGYSNGIL
ncbi:hypothetical protein JCM16303_004695 [Sporobolomyces ruberrimus]